VKWGTKFVKVSALGLPGDWKARLKDKRVQKELAPSIEATGGLIDLPVVRTNVKPAKVLSGADRLAALSFLGRAHRVEVRTVECDDLEARRIEASANAHRRQDRDAWMAKLVAIEEDAARAKVVEEVIASEAPRAEKPKKGKAYETVAAESGTTPAAVKQAAYRDRKKRGEVKSPAPKASIKTLGLEVGEVVLAAADTVKTALMKADVHLRQAMEAVNSLDGGKLIDLHLLKQMREHIDIAGQSVRERIPYAACPRCKRGGEMCSACLGYGWVPVGAKIWMEELAREAAGLEPQSPPEPEVADAV
jgi:hypothetical protein